MTNPFAVVINGTVVARFQTWREACADADLRNECHAYDIDGNPLADAPVAEPINIEFEADDPSLWNEG